MAFLTVVISPHVMMGMGRFMMIACAFFNVHRFVREILMKAVIMIMTTIS